MFKFSVKLGNISEIRKIETTPALAEKQFFNSALDSNQNSHFVELSSF